MTLPSRHKIRNSKPGGLRPSTLPLGHGGSAQYCVLRVDGEETILFFSQTAETGKRAQNSSVKGSGANHYPRAPTLPVKCYKPGVTSSSLSGIAIRIPGAAQTCPAAKKCLTKIVSMLGQRRRRWASIETILFERLVLLGDINGLPHCSSISGHSNPEMLY